ncbi:unnamed protein product [Strongylus vulgaris]|uniref:Uncharacterized protein n=1 Tax=Strongylus vulgaris TaxID=40348 RepID=A0A3P7JG12_STRVU|nr:unnamed protein product [Strongylus vulgaris]
MDLDLANVADAASWITLARGRNGRTTLGPARQGMSQMLHSCLHKAATQEQIYDFGIENFKRFLLGIK